MDSILGTVTDFVFATTSRLAPEPLLFSGTGGSFAEGRNARNLTMTT